MVFFKLFPIGCIGLTYMYITRDLCTIYQNMEITYQLILVLVFESSVTNNNSLHYIAIDGANTVG